MNPETHDRGIYSVTRLTREIKTLLEDRFSLIWVLGEISNFSTPVSGHYYFTLKDAKAQIRAVMFRGQNRNLKFVPEDGMMVTGLGRISVYEPRGAYQVIFEYLEPKGVGALQIAFEQLKNRLTAEGLFDESHKKAIPFLPRKISIVTSPTGAVIHDMMHIIDRRFPNVHLEVVPVKVQGDGAADEIVNGLELINRRADSDLIVLARGGGSIEDLQAFNAEPVARSIFASDIPVVSAVGHETDYTIADFVADLRAPTPSAAAELIVPEKQELGQKCAALETYLHTLIHQYFKNFTHRIEELTKRLVDPGKRVQDLRLRTDDYTTRLIRKCRQILLQKREALNWRHDRLFANSPQNQLKNERNRRAQLHNRLTAAVQTTLTTHGSKYHALAAGLSALNPVAILDRGYSITRTVPEKRIVRNADEVSMGQTLEILLSSGSLICSVEGKELNGKEDL